MAELTRALPENPNKQLCYFPERLRNIVLAAGNFWSAQAFFTRVFGVADCIAGYANGELRTARFADVEQGQSGFAFAVRVLYDPDILSLGQLLDLFFSIIDPVARDHQGFDWGPEYRTGIYYTDEADRDVIAAAFERARQKHAERIAVEFKPLINFVAAESEQQHYLEAHPEVYRTLDFDLLEQLPERFGLKTPPAPTAPPRFSKPDEASLRARLNEEQYRVTQEKGTERPFVNAYFDEKGEGLYVDIVSGEPLFSSRDKFDSGCGWPSFTRPLEAALLEEHDDSSRGLKRIEVVSSLAQSHLGHVFPDGPKDRGGLRYCINSAALRFVPKEDLAEAGLADYLALFGD